MLLFNFNVQTLEPPVIFFQDNIIGERIYPWDATFDLYGVLQVLLSAVQFVCVYFFTIIIFIAIFLSQIIY